MWLYVTQFDCNNSRLQKATVKKMNGAWKQSKNLGKAQTA